MTTSTTARTLRRQRIALLTVALVVCATAATLLAMATHSAHGIQADATSAADQIATARQALTEADTAAVGSLGSAAARLTGPGNDYLGEITLASQSLEQVAEGNEAGPPGSQELRLIGSLISTYSGMVEQANAAYASGQNELGLAEVWYASDFMHMPQSGILAELDNLERDESAGLSAEDSSFWTSPWTVPIWGAPAIVLLVLLVRTQRYGSKRFQRTLNPALAVSSVLVLAMLVVGPLLALAADRTLADSITGLQAVTTDRDQQIEDFNTGQRTLAALLDPYCPSAAVGCHATVDAVAGEVPKHPAPAGATQQPQLTRDATQVATIDGRQTWAVNTDLGLAIGLGAAAASVALGVLLGMRERISDYRYRA